MTSVNQSQVRSPLQVPKIPNSHIQEQQGKRGSGFTCAGGQHNQANPAPCGFTRRLPRQPWSGHVATRSREERAAFEVRAALRLQTRNAQACSQMRRRRLEVTSPKSVLVPGHLSTQDAFTGASQSHARHRSCLETRSFSSRRCVPPPGSVLLPVLSPEPGRTEPGRAGPPGRGR